MTSEVSFFSVFFVFGVPQRLDAGDLGRPTRYCYLESIYHTWDGGTDHWASLVSHPTQCVAIPSWEGFTEQAALIGL